MHTSFEKNKCTETKENNRKIPNQFIESDQCTRTSNNVQSLAKVEKFLALRRTDCHGVNGNFDMSLKQSSAQTTSFVTGEQHVVTKSRSTWAKCSPAEPCASIGNRQKAQSKPLSVQHYGIRCTFINGVKSRQNENLCPSS